MVFLVELGWKANCFFIFYQIIFGDSGAGVQTPSQQQSGGTQLRHDREGRFTVGDEGFRETERPCNPKAPPATQTAVRCRLLAFGDLIKYRETRAT